MLFCNVGLYSFLIFFCLPRMCWGYVDPGSISIFIQFLGVFVLGAFITLRQKIIDFIKFFFQKGKVRRENKKPEESDDNH